LTSAEYLNLHGENGPGEPMKSLKISAGVHIRGAEVEHNGFRIRASFHVSGDVIEAARLESDPARNWLEVERKLQGVPYKEWQRYL
jgi:hypothetical protein